MALNTYSIIKGVVLTTKSTELLKKLGKITFKIDKFANKIMVRDAVEKIWDVKVKNIRIILIAGKNRRFAGKTYKSSARKKAIVTLREGYKIDLPTHFESTGIEKPGVASEAEVK